jgi:hypothetical protein
VVGDQFESWPTELSQAEVGQTGGLWAAASGRGIVLQLNPSGARMPLHRNWRPSARYCRERGDVTPLFNPTASADLRIGLAPEVAHLFP